MSPLLRDFLIDQDHFGRTRYGAATAHFLRKRFNLTNCSALLCLVEDEILLMVDVFAINVRDNCMLLTQFGRIRHGINYAYVLIYGASGGPITNSFYLANRNGMVAQFYFGMLTIIPICYRVLSRLRDVRILFMILGRINDRLRQTMWDCVRDRLLDGYDLRLSIKRVTRGIGFNVRSAQYMVRQATGRTIR